MKARFITTLKAWPAITLVTVMLCFLTQEGAKLLGIELPVQTNIEIVRSYAGCNLVFASLVLQIVVLLPAIEEALFRWGLWKFPLDRMRGAGSRLALVVAAALLSSAVFSFAHYIDYTAWAKTGEFTLRALDNAFLALFFFGLAQCRLYRRTGSLFCAILNHGLFNLANLVLIFVFPENVS